MRRLVTLFLVIPLLGTVAAPTGAQSPTTTEELLSGMVTEEVESGVFRVVNDGVRDITTREAERTSRMRSWWMRQGGSGAICPGTLWVLADASGGLARFDDPGWTTFTVADGPVSWSEGASSSTDLLEAAADGSVWLNGGPFEGVLHFDGTTWTSYLAGHDIGEHNIHDFAIAPDGSIWLFADGYDNERDTDIPLRLYVISPRPWRLASSHDLPSCGSIPSGYAPLDAALPPLPPRPRLVGRGHRPRAR